MEDDNGQKNVPKPETLPAQPPIPEDDDLDKEVSWQAMARASLNQAKKPVVSSQKSKEKPIILAPSPQPLIPDTEFVQEELPADFWDHESVPVEAYSDEEAKTSEAKPTAPTASPIHHPLFAELQRLFPGRIVRLEIPKTSNKANDKEEESPPSDTLIDESDA